MKKMEVNKAEKLPKVSSGVVFHVELFVRKGGQVDITECREHLS